MASPERCQSGRLGRSRKPLSGQLDRGFESLSLRKAQECQAVSDGLVSVLWSTTSLLPGEECNIKQRTEAPPLHSCALQVSTNGITAGNPIFPRPAHACIVSCSFLRAGITAGNPNRLCIPALCKFPSMGSPQVIQHSPAPRMPVLSVTVSSGQVLFFAGNGILINFALYVSSSFQLLPVCACNGRNHCGLVLPANSGPAFSG